MKETKTIATSTATSENGKLVGSDNMDRTIVNPVFKDTATFLKRAGETGASTASVK